MLDERRERLERFLTAGIDEETHRAIGDLPRGRGVLGVLITRPAAAAARRRRRAPAVVRLSARAPADDDVPRRADHHRRRGLGEPLPDREGGGEFTDEDEEAAVVLADWAAIAIGNARLYRTVRERRDELERTMRGLETTTEISRALGGVTDLDRVLELVVKRSRALIDARAAEIALLDGDEFVIAAVAGEGVEGLEGPGMPVADSLAARRCRPGASSASTGSRRTRSPTRELGARSAIVTPMMFRNRPVGFLIVFDRLTATGRSTRRTSGCCRRSRRARRPRWRPRRTRARRRCGAASRPPRPSARAGRASCTTRRCSSSPGLRVLLSGARRSGDAERAWTARSTARSSRSRPRSATCAR